MILFPIPIPWPISVPAKMQQASFVINIVSESPALIMDSGFKPNRKPTQAPSPAKWPHSIITKIHRAAKHTLPAKAHRIFFISDCALSSSSHVFKNTALKETTATEVVIAVLNTAIKDIKSLPSYYFITEYHVNELN